MPMFTPAAPRTRAAASPRPSAMPPAASTGTGATASTTCGTSAIVADLAAEAAGLPALGDEHVGALLDGALGLLDGVHLGHEERAGVVRARREVAGLADGQRHDGGLGFEPDREGVLGERARACG